MSSPNYLEEFFYRYWRFILVNTLQSKLRAPQLKCVFGRIKGLYGGEYLCRSPIQCVTSLIRIELTQKIFNPPKIETQLSGNAHL
jgi:hypothetical protein